MVRRIFINSTPTHLRIAITEDGKLAELFTEEPERTDTVGNIYLGKVSKVVQGMNAAFVDIGLEQDAFLHFSDVDESMEDNEDDDDEDARNQAVELPETDKVDSVEVALRLAKPVSKKKLPTFATKRSGLIAINLHARQQVVVQVTRDAYGTKGGTSYCCHSTLPLAYHEKWSR